MQVPHSLMYLNIWFPFCPVLLRCEQTINHATTRHAGLHFKTENQSKPYLIYVAFCQRFCHSNEQERELIDFFEAFWSFKFHALCSLLPAVGLKWPLLPLPAKCMLLFPHARDTVLTHCWSCSTTHAPCSISSLLGHVSPSSF